MPRNLLILFLLTLLSIPAFARGGHSSHARSYSHRSVRCIGCARDTHGRIKRSASAKREFRREHPCPATGRSSGACPGYVIDHVQALKHGGADSPSNMQWQTKAEAAAKDKIE